MIFYNSTDCELSPVAESSRKSCFKLICKALFPWLTATLAQSLFSILSPELYENPLEVDQNTWQLYFVIKNGLN